MARQQKYQSPTKQITFRIPLFILRALDNEAVRQNRPRAEVVLNMLIAEFGDKPLKPARSVFE